MGHQVQPLTVGIIEFMKCFGLEGTFRGHVVQPPCSEQGHLPLDQVPQSPVQPDLESLQGWGLHHLSEQPVPAFHHPHCQKCLPYIQSKSTLPWFKPLLLVLSQGALLKYLSPSFL